MAILKKIQDRYINSNLNILIKIILGVSAAIITANTFILVTSNIYQTSIGHKKEEIKILNDLNLGVGIPKSYFDYRLGPPKQYRRLDNFESYVYQRDYYYIKIFTPIDMDEVVLYSVISDKEIPITSIYTEPEEIILGKTQLNSISGEVKGLSLATTQLLFVVSPPNRPNNFNYYIYSYSNFFGDLVDFPNEGEEIYIKSDKDTSFLANLSSLPILSSELSKNIHINTITITNLELNELDIFSIGLNDLDHGSL